MIEPMGRLSMFPLPPFPFPSIFTRISPPLPSPLSSFPLPPVSLSCEIYRHWREVPGGIQSADIVVTVRRMRENKDKPKEEAEEREEEEASQFKFTRKRYRRPRNAPETKSVSQ